MCPGSALRIMSLNVNKHLSAAPPPRASLPGARVGLADHVRTLAQLFVRCELDFMLLQEVGISDNVVFPLVESLFRQIGAEVFQNGVRNVVDGGSTGTMIVVATKGKGWGVSDVRRHSSGRVLSLMATRGRFSARVICAYMPQGLDYVPRVPNPNWRSGASRRGYARWQLAQVLYQHIQTLLRPGVFFLIGGDLNETRGERDRVRVSNGTQGGAPPTGGVNQGGSVSVPSPKHGDPASLINVFLSDNPRVVEDIFLLRSAKPFFTRRGPTRAATRTAGDGGSITHSRIDYILVPTSSCSARKARWSTVGFPVGTILSDHDAIMATYTPPSLGARADGPRPGAWTPGFTRLQQTTHAQREKIRRGAEEFAAKLLVTWPSRGRPDRDDGILLNNLTLRFHAGIRKVLSSSVPAQRPRSKGGRRRLTPSQRAVDTVSALSVLRTSLQRIDAGQDSVNSRTHRRAVGTLQNLLGGFQGICHDDVRGLRALEETERPRARRRMWETSGVKSDVEGYRDNMFNNRARLGDFVDNFLRESPGGGLNHARREDGSIAWDPLEYKPMIREIVSAPMGTRVRLPPPFQLPRNAPLSADARAWGCRPSWWDEVYDRKAKGISSSVYRSLMRPASCAEVWTHGIGHAKGGVSAGHDGVNVDVWKLITGGFPEGRCSCLEVATRIVNWCLCTSFVPRTLKHGGITMVPKPRKDGSYTSEAGEMRPITVLPELGKIMSRVLASRLGEILVHNPLLVSPAQRGVIRDGSADQCVGVVTDAIEDWKQRGGKTELFLLSYDQAKAYDSVQGYTIRAF